MGIRSFFSLDLPRDEKVLKILCLACWSWGGIFYAWNIYDTFIWTYTYPHPNMLVVATWVMHFALRIFCMWLPMSFILIQYKRDVVGLYLLGGVVAICFSICAVAVGLTAIYDKDGILEDVYFRNVKPSVENGSFPLTMMGALTMDGCCSWYGPSDFSEMYGIEKLRDSNEDFMKHVAQCYGGIFTVEKGGGVNLRYVPSSSESDNPPTDCARIYMQRANRICIYIIIMAVPIWIVTPILIRSHYKCTTKFEIRPVRRPQVVFRVKANEVGEWFGILLALMFLQELSKEEEGRRKSVTGLPQELSREEEGRRTSVTGNEPEDR